MDYQARGEDLSAAAGERCKFQGDANCTISSILVCGDSKSSRFEGSEKMRKDSKSTPYIARRRLANGPPL